MTRLNSLFLLTLMLFRVSSQSPKNLNLSRNEVKIIRLSWSQGKTIFFLGLPLAISNISQNTHLLLQNKSLFFSYRCTQPGCNRGEVLGACRSPTCISPAKGMPLNRGATHFTLGLWTMDYLILPIICKYTCAPLSKFPSCAPARNNIHCLYTHIYRGCGGWIR